MTQSVNGNRDCKDCGYHFRLNSKPSRDLCKRTGHHCIWERAGKLPDKLSENCGHAAQYFWPKNSLNTIEVNKQP